MPNDLHSGAGDTPLVAEYSRRFRVVEVSAICLFAALFVALAARAHSTPFAIGVAGLALMLGGGALFADLVSGLVHWSADTWGNQTWPLVGPTLIRSFREHHLDEKAITRHDFVEANGATALVLLPALIGIYALLPRDASVWTGVDYRASIFALSACFFVFMTNQIHKWAHEDEPPALVRPLQRLNVILSAKHHRGHHSGQHTIRYCITTGWLNPLLDRSQFFRRSERVIQAISKLQPREDDLNLLRAAHRKGE
jgi:ubiquitin-conjugating enzyme E2 variant